MDDARYHSSAKQAMIDVVLSLKPLTLDLTWARLDRPRVQEAASDDHRIAIMALHNVRVSLRVDRGMLVRKPGLGLTTPVKLVSGGGAGSSAEAGTSAF